MTKSVALRKTHDEMNSSDVEEEDLELGDMESMSMLCLSNEDGLSKGGDNDGDDSVVVTGFFSEDYEEGCEIITDTEEIVGDGDDESDSVKSTRSECFKASNGGNHYGGKLWKRRCPNTMHKKVKPSNGSAAGVSAVSGYYSCPPSRATSPTKPIDIVYGGHSDFSVPKAYQASSRTKTRRNLFKAREDRLAKAWERKRDQLLSEEFASSDNNNYSDSHSSRTAHDSCGEEARISSPRPDATRAKSFTHVDLDELKGCLDLGFGFNYEEMPELSNTLPALELCYVMGQKFQDEINHHKSSPVSTLDNNADSPRSDGSGQSPIGNWKISSPGDHPQQVKERLKVWAQAVACTVRLCSS